MKIVFLNPLMLAAPLYGIEKEMYHVAGWLAGAGHQVTSVTGDRLFRHSAPADRNRAFIPPGVRWIGLRGYWHTTARYTQPSGAPLFTVPDLRRTVQGLHADALVVFNIGWPLTTWPLLLAAKRRRLPVLYRTAYHPPGGQPIMRALRRLVRLRTAG